MKERRICRRFDLRLRAKIEIEPGTLHEEGIVQELETEDICSGGAFSEH